jgi:hypothetical protein
MLCRIEISSCSFRPFKHLPRTPGDPTIIICNQTGLVWAFAEEVMCCSFATIGSTYCRASSGADLHGTANSRQSLVSRHKQCRSSQLSNSR